MHMTPTMNHLHDHEKGTALRKNIFHVYDLRVSQQAHHMCFFQYFVGLCIIWERYNNYYCDHNKKSDNFIYVQ